MNLDAVLGSVHSRPPASTIGDAGDVSETQLRDISREVFNSPTSRNVTTPAPQEAAPSGTPRPPASTAIPLVPCPFSVRSDG